MDEKTAIRIIVSGRVQGVGYRAWTAGNARQHGLTGWVRNLRTGEVEAVLHGDTAQLEAFIKQCWQGPRSAAVEQVSRYHYDGQESFSDFDVLPTA